ncbi:hypothetical protein AKL17_1359 [Frigidibacter mobilis]|uniref:cellulase n=1 Tax=Frigidibacter mobilis TaxID=1335048 RepID=A0A159Z395_9RHOB|nr:hypothetical protein AKL17_1359 [Frigidibacter mobilis]
MTLIRRTLLQRFVTAAVFAGLPGAALFAQLAPAASIPADHPLQAAWQAWRGSYVAPEGRVVDSFQQGASHSEGQGYGMALALSFGDGETFRRMFTWTETNLALRSDALLAWRWLPDALPHVPTATMPVMAICSTPGPSPGPRGCSACPTTPRVPAPSPPIWWRAAWCRCPGAPPR